jgi:hypothetical protein
VQLLNWLAERYDIEKNIRLMKKESLEMKNAITVNHLRSVLLNDTGKRTPRRFRNASTSNMAY